jgi:hypothetical protein
MLETVHQREKGIKKRVFVTRAVFQKNFLWWLLSEGRSVGEKLAQATLTFLLLEGEPCIDMHESK